MNAPASSPPGPAAGTAKTSATKPAARGLSRAMLERLVLGILLAVSLGVIWWSVGRLLELQGRSRTLNQQVAKLSGEIDVMRVKWSGARTREVGDRFGTVGSTLFLGETAMAEWTETIRRESIPLALETRFRVTGTRVVTNTATPFTRILATLEAEPNSGVKSARSVYQRLVDWTRKVALEQRRVDLLEFSVSGNSPETSTASATVEFWAQDPPPPSTAPTSLATSTTAASTP